MTHSVLLSGTPSEEIIEKSKIIEWFIDIVFERGKLEFID